jgi:hypothetical protein
MHEEIGGSVAGRRDDVGGDAAKIHLYLCRHPAFRVDDPASSALTASTI